MNAKLAKVVTLSLSEMEPVPVASLNAVLAKFAKMDNALGDSLLTHLLAEDNVLKAKSALMENVSDKPQLVDVLRSDVVSELSAETDSAFNQNQSIIALLLLFYSDQLAEMDNAFKVLPTDVLM